MVFDSCLAYIHFASLFLHVALIFPRFSVCPHFTFCTFPSIRTCVGIVTDLNIKMRWRLFSILRLRRDYGTSSKHEWESQDMPVYDYGWMKKRKKTSVYGWGLSAAGELGVHLNKEDGMMRRRILKPIRLVEIDKNQVTDLSCGRGFSVFVSKENRRIFGCGLNTSGQLGLQSTSNPDWVLKPKSLPVPLTERAKPIAVACGRQHCLVATDQKEVYSLGSNAHGQCGRTIIEDEDYAKGGILHRLDEFDGPVRQLACGLDHSLVLTQHGSVYAFGCGTDGQLGNGSCASQWKPSVVGGDVKAEKIVQLACTADCVLAVSEKGDVFGWGNNEYKQLHTATAEIQTLVPRKLNLGIGKVVHVASGGSSCAAVTESGQLYVWGYGVIGQGPRVSVRSNPSLLPPPLFGATEFEPNVKVKFVYAGLSHFAAINSKGELFVWGSNRNGHLGLGHETDQYFPFKVPLGCEVIKVACGPDHTMALCKAWS